MIILSNSCLGQPITINNVYPSPNYPSGQSVNLGVLTDGSYSAGNWLSNAWVGWENKQKVSLIVSLNDSGLFRNKAAVLKIHARTKKSADILPPLAIDVYSIDNGYQLLGSYLQTQNHINSSENLWLDVPISKPTDQMLMVIHANGQYIQISEILVKQPGKIVSVLSGNKLPTIDDAIKASSDRLVDGMMSKSQATFKMNIIKGYDVNDPSFGIAKQVIWGDLSDSELTNSYAKYTRFDIKGVSGENVYFIFSLINYSKNILPVTFDVENESDHLLDFMEAKPIVAADGKVVFDPLFPISSDSVLNIQPESRMIILGKLRLGKYPKSDIIKASFIAENKSRKTIDIQVETIAWKWNESKVFVHNWAYSHQQPIWNNRTLIEQDLMTHGVNVKVLHHSRVPRIIDSRKAYSKAKTALTKELNQSQKSDFVLLYLGFHPSRADKYIGRFEDTESKRKALKEWLIDLKITMKQAGYNENQWALYPFDEPKGKNMHVVASVFSTLKSVDPAVKIFVTPSSGSSRKRKTTASDLNKISEYVDIWQPSIRLINEVGSEYFATNKPRFWLYNNPDYPAKSSSVYDDYRSLGIDAWSYGARGVGFWSYSDTRKSSAWSDFDSNTGDWAVVYESEQGPVSSMRWEAFLDGVEDMKQLYSIQDKLNTNREKSDFVRRINDIIKIDDKEKVPSTIKRALFMFIEKLRGNVVSDNERDSG